MASIWLRARGTLSLSIYDYPHCAVERSPFAYASSPPTCCCCCCCCFANSRCRVPVTSGYCYNLYGLRQSSLIQLSHYRKFASRGLDRYYARLPVSDVDASCYCDDGFSPRKTTSVRGRKRELRNCRVFEERSEACDVGDVDEAEILLSLLTEDVSEECLLAARGSRRLGKKPEVERRASGEVSSKHGSRKKRDGVGVLESENRCGYESVVSLRKKGNGREVEVVQSEGEKGGSLRREDGKAALRQEHADGLLTRRSARKEEERVALLKKASQEEKLKEERGSKLREENWKVASRTDEREDLIRREEHGQRLRKGGSSCSSYFSFSSGGDYESDKEIQLREGRYSGESSSSHMKSSKSNEIVYRHAREEEERRHEDHREEHENTLTKKSSEAESRVCESDFRKKSEKKLDVSVQEIELRKEALHKESKHSMVHEGNYGKSSDYHVSYDDMLAKSSGSSKFDERSKQQYGQTGIPRQTETRLKYKQFGEMQESYGEDVITSYGSQKIYSAKGEMPAKVATSSRETVGEHRRTAGHSSREDEHRRSSIQVAELSERQDIETRKVSTTQQRFETSVKEEDHSTNISISDATKKTQYDQVSGPTGKTQLVTKKEGKSILKKVSDRHVKQEETLNLASGSSSQSKIMKSDDSKKRYDEWIKTSFTHLGDSGAIEKDGTKKTESITEVEIPSNLVETGTSCWRSNVGSAANEVSERSSQSGFTSLPGSKFERCPALHHEAYLEEHSTNAPGQSSKLISQEDAIRSAAQFEKSSAQYVSEFVGQVRNEFSSSEIQREKRTNETRVVHQEQQHQHNIVQYSSGDSQSKEHELRSDSQQSGTKGPSDEMWKVDEPSLQESSRTEVSDDAIKAGKDMDKRTGRSLWSRISDIVLLRWSSHSESHSSDRKAGGRSPSNQATSSDTWISGHEAAENQEVTEEKEHKSPTQGLPGSNQEGSSSSMPKDNRKHVGINAPSPPDAQQLQPTLSTLHSEVISEGISTGAMAESLIHLPATRMQRSPTVHGVSEAGEANASDSGRREKLNAGLIVQTESAAVDEGELKRRKFQRQDQVIKDRFDEWEAAYQLDAEQRKIDEMFMREALVEAQNAADNWEVPVGAILVHDGKIIARGFNMVEELRDSTAHAEMICIREASNLLRTWRLSDTTLYVTLEPCPMCAGAILQARIDTVVWGAPNKLLGADGSWIRLFPNGDGGNNLELTDKPAAPVHPFHPKIVIRRGVLQSECADAMQQFFRLRRKKKDKKSNSPRSLSPPSCLPVSHRPSKLMAMMHDAFAPRFFC